MITMGRKEESETWEQWRWVCRSYGMRAHLGKLGRSGGWCRWGRQSGRQCRARI